MVSPLLHAHDLRVDAGGAPSVDGLALRADGERAIVLGAPRALFEATSGARAIARGSLLVLGTPAAEALREGLVAGAPLDPEMPKAWTSLHYATWRARLSGHGKSEAEGRAEASLRALGALGTATSALKVAPPHVRRAAVLAGALATGASTLVFEDPLAGLPAPVARPFAAAVLEALAGHTWVLFGGRTSIENPFASRADVALVVHGSSVVAQGRPAVLAAAANAFSLRVLGDGARFAEVARSRGARVTAGASTGDASEAIFTVELEGAEAGAAPSTWLFDIAHETHATIVELAPIARAFG